MCGLDERVHRCGHYEKAQSWACDDAKARKSVRKTGEKTTSTTTGVAGCHLMGCDGNASPKGEGPGQYIVFPLRMMDPNFDRRENRWWI
jgi:hypothetical protein